MNRLSITAIVAAAIWLSFDVMGYQAIQGIAAQHVQGYPNADQIRFYLVFPLIVTTAVTVMAICFWFGRLKALTRVVNVLSFFFLLPYLFFYTGGM